MPKQYCNLYFDKTIDRWDEALPLGNGFMGALVWGPAKALRFSLDRTDLWDTTPYPGVSLPEFSYETMVRLAGNKDMAQISRIFDAPYNHAAPTKLPAGKIILHTAVEGPVKSRLDIGRAQAEISFEHTQIKSFLHAEKKIGFLKIFASAKVVLELENPQYGLLGQAAEATPVDTVNTQASLQRLHYPAPEKHCEGELSWFVQQISPSFSYGVVVAVRTFAEGMEIAYTVAAASDGAHWLQNAQKAVRTALAQGYESNFKTHCAWWKRYWAQSAVCLPDKLAEKNWYRTNYLFAACSRKGCFPMPLQGVWTADDGNLPPWKGDYHHDLNTQMSYMHYLKANHLAEGECFVDYLWSMAQCGRDFAKQYYGVTQGLCLPAVMTIDGAPLGGWGMYSLSPTNQLWLCQSFERYYRFSGDEGFLRQKAYPYLKETAEFILELLEERDGFYYLPISSSPEIHDDTERAFVTPNSNYDLALMRYLFQSLAALARTQGLAEAEKWNAALSKLPPLAVNEKNVLMISPDESLEESHRHMSHLMSVYPLRLLEYRSPREKEIIDASILDLERLGTGMWVGYSFCWMAELYAVQKNGNAALRCLHDFWNYFCLPNGFHANGDYKKYGRSSFHYRPFTLEGNMCAADALQEMLLQSENGVLELFPAIAQEWEAQKVSFTGFRAEQGLVVSATLEHGQVTVLKLEGNLAGSPRLRRSRTLEALQEKYRWEMQEDCFVLSPDGSSCARDDDDSFKKTKKLQGKMIFTAAKQHNAGEQ